MTEIKNITINGVTHTIDKWSELSGISNEIIHSRLTRGVTDTKLIAPVTQEELYNTIYDIADVIIRIE